MLVLVMVMVMGDADGWTKDNMFIYFNLELFHGSVRTVVSILHCG